MIERSSFFFYVFDGAVGQFFQYVVAAKPVCQQHGTIFDVTIKNGNQFFYGWFRPVGCFNDYFTFSLNTGT